MIKITPPEFYSKILRVKNIQKTFKDPIINRLFLFVFVFVLSSGGLPDAKQFNGKNFKSWTWKEVNDDASWKRRAGLQALNFDGDFYIMGGRHALAFPPGANEILGDVWKSTDLGETWEEILPTNPPGPVFNRWANRAYFQAVKKGKYMYILGGQDFIFDPISQELKSNFFNDVWRSEDGISWTEMTKNSPPESRWRGRAGLSSVVFNGWIYVMGGSENDDCASIPGGCPGGAPPPRIYYNDVWKSKNGEDWILVTDDAEWKPRAGGVAVVKDGYIYMIGGEEGFICTPPIPGVPSSPCPPYFNDVWRSRNGKNWELLTENAAWDKRPGHQVVVAENRFVLFGGFGLGNDNGFTPSNPRDIWISNKGKVWKKISDAPWNAEGSMNVKYDFAAFTLKGKRGKADAVYTFGGDRETFDFSDPMNYLRMDNDVWKFTFIKKDNPDKELGPIPDFAPNVVLSNFPNPFSESTTLSYTIDKKGFVQIKVFDRYGRLIETLVMNNQEAGTYQITWDAINKKGRKAPPGVYYVKLISPGKAQVRKIFLRN